MSEKIIGANGATLKAGDRVFVYDLDDQNHQTKVYGVLCYDTAKNEWSVKYDDNIECIVLYNEGVNKCDKTYREKGKKGICLISFNPISTNKWVYNRYFNPEKAK
jgi:hypothetical protein